MRGDTNEIRLNPSISNGRFCLEFMGSAGSIYTFQASSNLRDWVNSATIDGVSGLMRVADPEKLNHPYRFYRIIREQ
jgi:hypothetical protein